MGQEAISFEELLQQYRGKGINLVAFITTPWHYYGVLSFVLQQQQEHKRVNGLILVPQGYGKALENITIPTIKGVQLNILCVTTRSVAKTFPQKLRAKLCYYRFFWNRPRQDNVFFLSPVAPQYWLMSKLEDAWGRSAIGVVIDEGLGAYMRSPWGWAKEVFHNTHSRKQFLGGLLQYGVFNPLRNHLLKWSHQLEERPLLLPGVREKFLPNWQVAHFYRKAFQLQNTPVSSKLKRQYEKAVVISNQLYHTTGQLQQDADLKLYQHICDFCRQKNIPVVFKPHPREHTITRYQSLDCVMDTDYQTAQEQLFSQLEQLPRCVVGFTTTTLVTSSVFYGIPTISLAKLLEPQEISHDFKVELDRFAACFEGMVKLPETIGELEQLFT